MRRLLARRGLRQRVALTFGLGALLVAVFVAVTTYAIAANYLWSQRGSTTLRQASFNARVVDAELVSEAPSPDVLLERVDSTEETSSPLIWWRGRWYDDHFRPGIEALPPEFVAAVKAGRAVTQRFDRPGGIVVAIAIPVHDGSYVEIFPLDELDSTLATIGVVLVGTTTLATALGVLVGRGASRRALRPLTAVTAAAGAIAAGDLDARLGTQTDPDLHIIAAAFDDTATRLQARVERDARFAADVTHELRSPLTTMVNAVDLLRARSDEVTPETSEILMLLSDDVHRFAQMVKDLLELALADASSTPAIRHDTAVHAVVASVADRIAGRPVTRALTGADPVADIDPRRLERIVENLVRNAEAHGGGVCDVWVEKAGDVVRIHVEDSGPGVPPEDSERVFERFARGARSATSSGVGLGLALVDEHVRANGGRIWVAPGEDGAHFIVQLPVADR